MAYGGVAVPAAVCLCLLGSPALAGSPAGKTLEGTTAELGGGNASTFAELAPDGAPVAIGVRLDAAALESLPDERNLTSRCFDLDGNGQMEATECEGDTEVRLALPEHLAARDDIPFKWVMINWHPHGHPPGFWEVGHFDVHFYMVPEMEIDAIRLGSCGILIDCEDFARATKPVSPEFVHPDHISVDAAVGQMGNHLIDSKTPEMNDPAIPFSHTWIIGAYDARIIFQEVMLTRDHLLEQQSGCHQIKQPSAWQATGWYPTRYCIDWAADRGVHEITLRDFVLREAAVPKA